MRVVLVRITRFVLNVAVFAFVLFGITHYSYISEPELSGLKNALLPYEAAVFLCLIASILLAGLNEVVTIIAIKITAGRKKQ